ncbi:MAG: hypothetical protein ACREBW_06070 [Candidatus Micrarchaeaceae archaeon]
MKKVLLMIDCDGCRQLYEMIRVASEDTTAWHVHGDRLTRMAMKDGWARTEDDNSHYCPDCVLSLEKMIVFLDEPFGAIDFDTMRDQ